MRFEHSVTIGAPVGTVWKVLVDVEAWPQLTPSMSSVEQLDPGPLNVGTRVRIKQPRLPWTQWTVTECVEGQRFDWESKNIGMRTRAVHSVLEALGAATLRLELEMHGPLATPAGIAFGPMTRKYLALEADGMKRRAESLA